jgi:transcriptional regulator with XRE-family HTH domain
MALGNIQGTRHTAPMGREYNKVALGQRVKSLRLQAGFTQAILSQRSGFYTTHISRIECGDANPTLSAVVAIANALNVPPYALLECIENEAPGKE